jgi:hypothetical protein
VSRESIERERLSVPSVRRATARVVPLNWSSRKIVGPVCEDSVSAESGLLTNVYDLRLSSEGKRLTLGQMSEGSLPSSHASLSWRIETGVLKNNLLDPNSPLLDVRVGEFFQIVAWTEPR